MPLIIGDEVIIRGVVTELDAAGNTTVEFMQKGEIVAEKFDEEELVKVISATSTIVGVLSEPT